MSRGRLGVAALVACSMVFAAALRIRAQWIDGKVSAAVAAPPPGPDAGRPCGTDLGVDVIIGDSRVAQWPMRLFGDVPVANRGIAGETALQLASRFHRDALACRPRTVLIAAGINDLVAASLAPGDTAAAIVARLPGRLIALADEAARAGATVLVATVIPPAAPDLLRRLAWSDAVRGYVADVNARLRAHPWTGPASLIDLAAALDANGTGVLPRRYRRDTLHLNAAAYRCLTALLPFAPPSPTIGAAACGHAAG